MTISILQDALEFDNNLLEATGGCTDGGCAISRPKGMHTNGGCRCYTNKIKMQRLALAHVKLREAVSKFLETT